MYKTLKLKNEKNHTYISFSSQFIVSIFEIYNFKIIPKLNFKMLHSSIYYFFKFQNKKSDLIYISSDFFIYLLIIRLKLQRLLMASFNSSSFTL